VSPEDTEQAADQVAKPPPAETTTKDTVASVIDRVTDVAES
jgi:hypothetical protein